MIFVTSLFTLFFLCFHPTSTAALHIVITGSSQGIGLEAARDLIQNGHTVYHACRSMERAEVARVDAGGGIPMVCDLADTESIRRFTSRLKNEAPALDVLCLNAGVAPSTKTGVVPQRTAQGYEICIGTNHLGHFLLASRLKEMVAENNGLIVITASSVHDPDQPGGAVGGKGGATLGDLSGLGMTDIDGGATMVDGSIVYDGGKVYKDSKLCNVLFAREALKRWGNDLRIRSFNPGFIPSSGLFREPRKDNWLGATAFTVVAGLIGFAVPINIGGKRLAYMATASDEDVPNGSYFSAEVGSRGVTLGDGFSPGRISKEAANDELATKLWDMSQSLLNSNED